MELLHLHNARFFRILQRGILLLFGIAGMYGVSIAQAPKIPVEPAIALISCTPQTAQAFTDSLTLTFSYIDGDGDLGENDPHVRNLFLVDSRNGLEYAYRLQKLWGKREKAAIKGTVNVIVDAPYLMDAKADTEEVVYTLYLKDRAGNESNRVETGAIKVTK